jgi:hypothetical protein
LNQQLTILKTVAQTDAPHGYDPADLISELLISAEIKLGSVPRSMANGVRKIGVPIPKPVVSTVFTDLAGISS